jgi:hypothetical protein
MKQIFLLTMLALGVLFESKVQAQPGGIPLWTNRYDGPGNLRGSSTTMAVDSGSNVLVLGYADGGDSSYDYTTIKYSGAGVPLWTNLYNGPENSEDVAGAVAVDGSGNVFVTGQSVGSLSGLDYATIAYSGAGMPLWTNRFDGPGNNTDYPQAIAVDASGNVFVTGTSYGSDTYNDYATIKYSGAGVPLWTNRYNGLGNSHDEPSAMAADGSGNVFVTGRSVPSVGGSDYTTIKYSGAGIALWTNYYSGPGGFTDQAYALVVDGSGNVFVTGVSYEPFAYPSSEYVTIAYSGTGVALWTNRYDGPGKNQDVAGGIALDGSGNVFVTGYSVGTDGFYSDYLTIKYSGAGVPLWTNRYSGSGIHHDVPSTLAVDSRGNVFVTGYSYGTGASDYLTIAYSGAGVPLWTNRYNNSTNYDAIPRSIALDGNGNVFVTGYSLNNDFTTIKYSSAVPPSLTIARASPNSVALSWPSTSTGFTLQQNTNGIATVNWSNVLTTPTDNGTTKTVIVNPPNGTRFYRLSSP